MIKIKLKDTFAESKIFKISNETRFSFVDVKDSQVISPVSCRTFMAEVLWSFITKKDVPRTDYKKEILNTTETKLTITFKSIKEQKYFLKRLPELHELEEKYNLNKTQYEETQEPLTYLLRGDIAWQKVWGITLYTFLLKRFTFSSDKSLPHPESEYIVPFLQNEKELMTAIATPKQEEVYQKTTDSVHSDGFVQLCRTRHLHINKWIFQ